MSDCSLDAHLLANGPARSLARGRFDPLFPIPEPFYPFATFLAAISIGTMVPSFGRIFGCLYEYCFPS